MIKIPYANISLCSEHFIKYYERRVLETVEKYQLISYGDKVVVALSGGKDSVAMLSALKSLIDSGSIRAELIPAFIDLGLGSYSKESEEVVKEACKALGLKPMVIRLKEATGLELPEIAGTSGRPICSVCGVIKRYLLNLVGYEIRASSIALGHHMDDLMSYALKALLLNDKEALPKLGPKTTSEGIAISRVRPLYLLTERENLVYALVKNLPFSKHSCPYSRHSGLEKELKSFLLKLDEKYSSLRVSFMKELAKESIKSLTKERTSFKPCKYCGMPSRTGICSFCKLTEGATGSPKGPQAKHYLKSLITEYMNIIND